MQAFWSVLRLSFRQQLTYRTALLAGLATNLFFAMLRTAVLTALYAGQPSVNGLQFSEAITYVAFTQGIIAFVALFNWTDLMQTVYSGSIAADLLKPIRFFTLWMAREAGRALVNLAARGVLLMACFALLYPLLLPPGRQHWLALPFTLVFAWLVSFVWRFLVNLSAFWTPDARGIMRLSMILMQLFSGFFMPLRLLPDWFSRLCAYTPFPAMINTPVEVFLGKVSGAALLQALAGQFLWFLALWLLAEVVLRLGLRKLVIQGG